VARGPGLFQRALSAIGKLAETAVKPIERVFQGEPRPSRRQETEFHKRRRLNPQGKLTAQQRAQQKQREQDQRQAQKLARQREARARRRPYDPWHAAWQRNVRGRAGYLDSRDFMQEIFYTYDISGDRQLEMWRDYVKWMVKPNQPYRRNDPAGPFWRKYGIDPDSWDWYAWRESMGYEHGNRRR
jgi:hypothetical protein